MIDSVRRVAVISLGGTIAMTAQTAAGATPTLSADDLVAAVPGLADTGIHVEVDDFRRLPGASLSFSDLLELAVKIETLAVDGVVITQGTDTIEETAYLLDLVTAGDMPVVVTGAMRNASMAGADGPANVLAAIRVAASSEARGAGCVVVFGEEIHAARWVRKTHATSPTAFTSYPGPIGYIAEDRVRIVTRPAGSAAVDPRDATAPARTAVVTVGLGDDGTILRAVGDQVDGLVVAAFGAGHVPMACVDALTDLAKRMPVILTTRTGSGPVLRQTYGFPGSESDLLARGLIPASTLAPMKARILLQLLLMTSATKDEITQSFNALP
ncbi:asparaginase [Streptomyces spectabilis]|uniref:L-asparaginase n=1 Tax=Streptomyces spectabilis TaxID=68270 RepID=A0A7W8EZH9_STRST|nr:asparaginase [Streptomyces spectabilis]MBB5109199.1 L-asparaginase [Streptomyces spectabilis]MCI3907755.1 asparaginase [Streptomyces spectabilis]GGV51326.1 L-asparaginase [Streptomyces spectabilis]